MRDSTKRRLKQVRAMYEANKSIKEIAAATGYKESSVGTILNQLGIYRAPRMCDCMDQIIKMRLNGSKLREISEATGFSVGKISRKLIEAGYRSQGIEQACVDPDVDLKSLTYAKLRKPKRCVIGGKSYIDIAPTIG